MKLKYKVENTYGIHGETNHNCVGSALQARDRREGLGWVVVDQAGNVWDHDSNGFATITSHAEA